jgi:hypothetical protein
MAASACKGWGAGALLALSLCAAGCASGPRIYTLLPQPVTVRPGSETPWGVDVVLNVADGVHLEVVNQSEEAVRLLWDDSAYVDVTGQSHRILTSKARKTAQRSRRSEADIVQVPTTVAPGSRIRERLYPMGDRAEAGNDPLLEGSGIKPPRRPLWRYLWPFGYVAPLDPLVGQTMSIYLVLEQNGERRTITAPYRISSAQ